MVQATLILYVFFIFGFSLTRGQYNLRLFVILTFSFILLALLYFSKKAKILFTNLSIDTLLVFAFIINILLYVLLYGGIYLQPGYAKTFLEFLLPVILASSFLFIFARRTPSSLTRRMNAKANTYFRGLRYLFAHVNLKEIPRPFRPRKFIVNIASFRKRVFLLNFTLLICLAFISRFLLILASPNPKIDTFDLFKLGPKYLLEGKNPYSQNYTPLYRGIEPNYYSYSPFTLYLFLPADLLFNDPRYTYLVSDLIVVFLLYKILSKAKNISNRAKYLFPLIFLYHPSESIILEQSWMDPLIFMMMVLFVYFERYSKELKKFSFIPLAFFFGMRHTMLIISPVFFLFKKIARKTVFLSLGAIFLAFLPFAVWNFGDFWDDLVMFYVTYPIRHDSITLNSFIFFTFGKDLPKTLMSTLGLLPLALVLIKRPDNWYKFLLGVALLLFALSFFNKLAFVNHYFLISLLILFAGIISLIETPSLK